MFSGIYTFGYGDKVRMTKPFSSALNDIRLFLQREPRRVYRKSDIPGILSPVRRLEWKLPSDLRTKPFLEELLASGLLRVMELKSPKYPGKNQIRYIFGEASPFELALSLQHGSYLSHGSAVLLHALTDQIPQTVYLNIEQSPKPAPLGGLAQAGLDRAFAGAQRESTFSYHLGTTSIVVLSGKNSGRLEVGSMPGPDGVELSVTRLERTLIDIAVRPVYGGGVYQVLEAFKGARGKSSVNVLLATLKKLGYLYPYHQAIGFYMERAGYPESALQRVEALGMEHSFYLTHGLREKAFDPRWRLFYPKGM